jgi:RHS repeat-associated protein
MYFDTAYAPFGENYVPSGTTDLDFTDKRQDTVTGIYDFQYREQNPNQGRWLSPDPAGLSAVDPSDPQSWNRYSYVVNTPLANTDPLGLEPGGGSGEQEGEYRIEGVDVPSYVFAAFAGGVSGSLVNCYGWCDLINKNVTGTYGGSYSLVVAAYGPVWINNYNGMELSTAAAVEAGIGAAPDPLKVPGFNYNIGNWRSGVLTRLKNSKCAKFFGGKGAKTVNSTQYLPFSAATNIFAETYPGSNVVWVNTLSSIFQALPGATFFQNLRVGGVSATDAGIYGLFHELSHQLTPTTGALYDAGNSPAAEGNNYINTLRVMNACPAP